MKKDRRNCFIFILCLFFLLSGWDAIIGSENIYPNIIKNNTYCSIYEFHLGYVKIQTIRGYDRFNQFDISASGPSQYDTSDLYDLSWSSNIALLNKNYKSDMWRGTVYYNPDLKFTPVIQSKPADEKLVYDKSKEILDTNLSNSSLGEGLYFISILASANDKENDSAIENFIYWTSYKLKRMPHLHTRKQLIPDKEYHLGINSAPSSFCGKDINLLAFPPGTEITEIFHHMPDKKFDLDGWTIFYYNLTDIEKNVGYHIKFKLSSINYPELSIDEIMDFLEKEVNK